jgi:hypothetical protein
VAFNEKASTGWPFLFGFSYFAPSRSFDAVAHSLITVK